MVPFSGSSFAIWMVIASLVLDYFDGPCARMMDMCSQFGDLLDHYTDHASMFWLVYVTASDGPWGKTNVAINALHAGGAFVYMAVKGHYFKHSVKGNVVTRNLEANNYWNFASMLWAANCMLVPLVKLSLAETHHKRPWEMTTPHMDVFDMLGGLVTLSYSIAVWF